MSVVALLMSVVALLTTLVVGLLVVSLIDGPSPRRSHR